MKIVNPLYDRAFKYLMENNRLAKKVVAVLLDVVVEELKLGQQETFFVSDTLKLNFFRLDFVATIRQADGSRQKVLIELQKSKNPTDIQRFRNYLGANYMDKKLDTTKTDEVKEPEAGYEPTELLPIITVYILGYPLPDLPYLAVKVDRDVKNSINKKKIETSCSFINLLTHQSHVIQVRRLPEKRRTRLEQFLSLFNQDWCTKDEYILELKEIPAAFKDIAQYLEGAVHDEAFRRQLEAEQEIEDRFKAQELKHLKEMNEAKQREEEAKQRADEAIQRANDAKHRADEAIRNAKEIQIKLVQIMKQQGLSIETLMKETGLSRQEIEEII